MTKEEINQEIHEGLEMYKSIEEEVKEFGLMPEIIIWALRAMQENSSLTICNAIMIGYQEWIK